MAKRTRSSARWLAEHASDPYVKRARAEGWRSRATFKLEEIQRTDRLIRPGMTVVDLGAAPGGWSQFAARALGGKGRVIALDVLAMPAVPGAQKIHFTCGDCFNFQTRACSRAPPPMTRTFMRSVSVGRSLQRVWAAA